MGSFENKFSATDVQPAGGGYKLRVAVTARPNNGTLNGKPDLSQGDSFRKTVAIWAKQPGQTIKAKDIAGKAQRAFGDATDNASQQIKGGAKQVEGKIQKGVGNVEEAADKADDDRR